MGNVFEWPSEDDFADMTIHWPLSTIRVFVTDEMITGFQVELGDDEVSPIIGKQSDYLANYKVEVDEPDSEIARVGFKTKAFPHRRYFYGFRLYNR